MSSTSLGKKQWDSTWDGLPEEIRLLIFEALMRDGCTLSRLATVSRDWQADLERHNFSRIRLTPSRLADFGSMIHRNRALLRYIWFCLELEDYNCTKCAPSHGILSNAEWADALTESLAITNTDKFPIIMAFQRLFSILSRWDPNGDLTLDISIYSLSDSQHWFKYLTFRPDATQDTLDGDGIEQTMSNKVFHDPDHGWVAGFRHSAPPRPAIFKVFLPVMEMGPLDGNPLPVEYPMWDQLPLVPVVTSVLLRQQNRRSWNPYSLALMFARFPRLQEVHYEPWREWDSTMYRFTDQGYEFLFNYIQLLNNNLKRLVLFENFNQQYPAHLQMFIGGVDVAGCESTRSPDPAVSRAIALASLKLEHLAASFLVDARNFFEIEPSWEWPNLTSLVLTSKILTPDNDPTEIRAMIEAAAAAATKMPRLETMEIWNGRKGFAALFKYQFSRSARQGTITWRGTWELALGPSLIQAWEAVTHQFGGWRLNLVEERLDGAAIKSHADAIHYLVLSGQVIRPISLQQIRIEQKALEGAATV